MADTTQSGNTFKSNAETAVASNTTAHEAFKASVRKWMVRRIPISCGILLLIWWGVVVIPNWYKWWINAPSPIVGSPSATQVQRDPLFETSCVAVSAIPSGQTGDFCVHMKGGVVTEKIKPPYYTNVGIYPFVPAELRYFDYDGKEMAVVKLSGRPEDCFTSPNGWTSFTILMKEDGGVRVRIGGRSSPRFAKCS